jgi:hypothetical protein
MRARAGFAQRRADPAFIATCVSTRAIVASHRAISARISASRARVAAP